MNHTSRILKEEYPLGGNKNPIEFKLLPFDALPFVGAHYIFRGLLLQKAPLAQNRSEQTIERQHWQRLQRSFTLLIMNAMHALHRMFSKTKFNHKVLIASQQESSFSGATRYHHLVL